ncbi:MAG: AAA family ATPase [Actinoallomurus sp.]
MAADERLDSPSPGDGARPRAMPGSSGRRPSWWIYRGTGRPLQDIDLGELLPAPPPWRDFDGGPVLPPPPGDERDLRRRLGPVESGRPMHPDAHEVDAVNAALYLRRPLLVTGEPGVGKSSLAYRIARELRLGRVLRWPVNSRSTLKEGLYEYDAIGRAQDAATVRRLNGSSAHHESGEAALADARIGRYLQLGPLGTALLPYEVPRVLLVDELDKSDIDLPNDLLDIFEEGEYRIPELFRISAREPKVGVYSADPDVQVEISKGRVRCRAFPIIIITSNGEREFPAAFLRRCLRLTVTEPDETRLADMVAAHFAERSDEHTRQLIKHFMEYRRAKSGLAADQLLNAVHLAASREKIEDADWEQLLDLIWQRLQPRGPE